MMMKLCPICNGSGDKEYQVGKQCLLRCRVCNFVYANATDQEIEQVNFHFDESVKWHYREVQSSIDLLWFDRIAARLTQGREGLRVLDIGCGNGVLLRQFQKRGCICFGSDPSPWAREYAQQYGYALLPCIEDADITPESFDIITTTSTLEHVAGPLEHVKHIMTAVKRGGTAYFTIPNFGSLPIRLRILKGRLVSPPGHCNYFTAQTLRNLFLQKGLKEQVAEVRVRSYGIPEIHAVYGRLSKRKPSVTHDSQSCKLKGTGLKKALISINYWFGAPFALGDKLEAWIQKK
ncbi:MAG: class I SAM-dependent methyltransferase [Planctomycetota bacterium]|jgi:2-polyprenyl-3-methyl-5-hydroxy-6-metoxy-1,4-benzoquinol methylase